MSFSHVVSMLFLSLFISSCNSQSNQTNDPVVYREANDPELEAAKQEAIAKLDYFIASFNQHSEDTLFQYSLKTEFIENGEHEHMWIGLNKITDGKFIGVLGNDPQIIQRIQYGDKVEITKEQIEDWIIYHADTDSLEGGFSIRVLQSRE